VIEEYALGDRRICATRSANKGLPKSDSAKSAIDEVGFGIVSTHLIVDN
jgi:hypothetical protein